MNAQNEQTNDPGYWRWVIDKAEDDIAEALKRLEELAEKEAAQIPPFEDEPF